MGSSEGLQLPGRVCAGLCKPQATQGFPGHGDHQGGLRSAREPSPADNTDANIR